MIACHPYRVVGNIGRIHCASSLLRLSYTHSSYWLYLLVNGAFAEVNVFPIHPKIAALVSGIPFSLGTFNRPTCGWCLHLGLHAWLL